MRPKLTGAVTSSVELYVLNEKFVGVSLRVLSSTIFVCLRLSNCIRLENYKKTTANVKKNMDAVDT